MSFHCDSFGDYTYIFNTTYDVISTMNLNKVTEI